MLTWDIYFWTFHLNFVYSLINARIWMNSCHYGKKKYLFYLKICTLSTVHWLHKFEINFPSLKINIALNAMIKSIVYFKCIFQKHNFVSLAAQTYGKRECQSRWPNSFSDATKSGISDFRWLTLSVTFGRPMLATIFSLFGRYLTVKPPSSCTDLLSAGRLKIVNMTKSKN